MTDSPCCSHIIGLFNSRVQSAPRQADQARENLRIIGKARNSKKIELIAMDKSMTYEEALELLPGVDATTPSDSGTCLCFQRLNLPFGSPISYTNFVFSAVVAVAVLVSSEAADEQKKKVPYALLLIGKEKGKENDLNGQVSDISNFVPKWVPSYALFTDASCIDRTSESCFRYVV